MKAIDVTFSDFGASQDDRWYANRRRQQPNADIDDLCFQRCAEIQGFHGVTHSNVAIHAHHGQGEYAGEHVVVVYGNYNFAQNIPKRPGIHQVDGALEGHGGSDQSICQSQVKNVYVGCCLHLCVSKW